MKITLRALTQKVALVSAAFVLAVSTLTAAVPFILSSGVAAAAPEGEITLLRPYYKKDGNTLKGVVTDILTSGITNASFIEVKFEDESGYWVTLTNANNNALNGANNGEVTATLVVNDSTYKPTSWIQSSDWMSPNAPVEATVTINYGGGKVVTKSEAIRSDINATAADIMPAITHVDAYYSAPAGASYTAIGVDFTVRNVASASSIELRINRDNNTTHSTFAKESVLTAVNSGAANGSKTTTGSIVIGGSRDSESWTTPEPVWSGQAAPVSVDVIVTFQNGRVITYRDNTISTSKATWPQVVVDNTRPSNVITAPLAGTTQPGTFTITGKATDATSGIERVHVWVTKYNAGGGFGGYIVDQDVLVDGSGNYELTVTLPHNEGPYGYRVHSAAYDRAGNVQNTEQTPVYVDTEAPTINLVSPSDGAIVKGASLAQSWATTSSDVVKYIYTSYNDQAKTSVRHSQEFSASVTSKTTTNVADATFWWEVTAIDARGNQSTSPLWKVTVDNIAPSVAITNPIGTLFNTDVQVLGTVTDENLRHYWVKVTRNGVEVYKQTILSSGIANEVLYTATLDGEYVVTLAARDKTGGGADTGNRSVDVVKSFTIDKEAPVLTNIELTQNSNAASVVDGGVTNSKFFTFNLSSIGDAIRYQLNYWNDILGSSFKIDTPWSVSDLSGYSTGLGVYVDQFTQGKGTHYFSFSACDAAGNCSPFSAPFVVTYDITAPVISFDAANYTFTGVPSIAGLVDDPTVTLKLIVNGGAPIDITDIDSGVWTYEFPSALLDGTYTLELVAEDAAGNTSYATATLVIATPTPETPEVQTATATPTEPGTPSPAAQAVLGETIEEGDVEGAKTVAQATDADVKSDDAKASDGTIWGLAWYWWLLIVAALGAAVWWFAGRKSQSEN